MVVVVIGAVTYPHLQWFLFEMEAREAFNDGTGLGRFPSSPALVGVKAILQKKAAAKGFATLAVSMTMTKRSFGPAKFWYVKAVMSSGSHTFENERRVEGFDDGDLEYLVENGFTIIGGQKDSED